MVGRAELRDVRVADGADGDEPRRRRVERGSGHSDVLPLLLFATHAADGRTQPIAAVDDEESTPPVGECRVRTPIGWCATSFDVDLLQGVFGFGPLVTPIVSRTTSAMIWELRLSQTSPLLASLVTDLLVNTVGCRRLRHRSMYCKSRLCTGGMVRANRNTMPDIPPQ